MEMLTMNADEHPAMKRMHKPGNEKRSVLILRPSDYDEWLYMLNVEVARAMLQFYPSEGMVTEFAAK
ncbi:hypothetical protein WL05_16660 [Burkholderia ubonensis]|nr:hypothetical protein WJ51_08750 [Burkholderia ubonensis]KVM18742.1 hypothetical protein WJ52_10700 [Burkholderia ubonensis]KVM48706.1 hypothetical protein WJ56_18910 [Burkholderia ubonensis]KVX47337.1 hypothetical protein WL05_16660 [Burkholderia ubonensis]KVX96345.1 hypothetical protein WL10_04545 [Burkholderia ubonensis]